MNGMRDVLLRSIVSGCVNLKICCIPDEKITASNYKIKLLLNTIYQGMVRRTYVWVLRQSVLNELLERIFARRYIDTSCLDPLALLRYLIKSLLTAPSDDHSRLGVKAVESEGEVPSDAGGSPENENAFGIFDTWHSGSPVRQ